MFASLRMRVSVDDQSHASLLACLLCIENEKAFRNVCCQLKSDTEIHTRKGVEKIILKR